MGGGELSLLDVIRNIGCESEVVLFSDGPFKQALEKIPVPVHVLSLGKAGSVRREAGMFSTLSSIPDLIQLRSQLRKRARGFDVIYANSQKAFLVSALAKRRKQVLIWHLRDILTAEHFSPMMRKLAVAFGNLTASKVIANSAATRESFIASGGRKNKAVIVYNGINPEAFDSIGMGQVERLRRELGLSGKFVAGIFGRLTPWKGQHVAIDAIAKVPDVELLLVGEALFGEQDYADGLRRDADRLGVKDRVHFLGFRRDIPALMKAVDVVIHASTAPEPFGRVIVEGMLANRPVVATGAGGAVEIVEHGQTGLLVKPDSSDELSQALVQLKTNIAFSREIGHAGRQRAEGAFSVKAMMNGIHTTIAGAKA